MQTIARVYPGKVSGLIVDYAGVFRSLEKAPAIYGPPGQGGGDKPVEDKAALAAALRRAIDETDGLCREQGLSLAAIRAAEGFERIERLKGKLAQKLMAMVRQNRTRIDYLDRFQALIDAYNAGSLNAEAFFEQLVELAERLPDAYSPELFEEKAGVVFQHVYETYYGGGGSVYAQTA